MNLPKITVKRPVATAMAFLAVLLFGIASMQMLSTDVLPDLELPSVTVITVYPGASAEEVEKQVTNELEDVLAGTENLKQITSKSKENVSFISLQFNWGADIDQASNDIRDLLELKKRDLPADAINPRIYRINSSMIPVVVYGISADEHSPSLNTIIEDEIAPEIRKVNGVGTVLILGQKEREIKIHVNPEKLSAYNLNVNQISTILKSENITIPGGSVKVGRRDFAVRVPGEIKDIIELENIALVNFNDKIIRLKDVAELEDGYKEKDEVARAGQQKAVAFFVQKQSGTNTMDVYEGTVNRMREIQKSLPEDLEVKELINSSELVTKAIGNLSSTIWFAALFVIIVVFVFLREWKSSLIIIMTIPFSLIIAFICMYFFGYTINIFSLISLVIAIGMVVDNAIVVLENITRHIEEGERPDQASIFGTGEMGTAIMASTATTISVFIPMLFIGGIVGILFRQLAILTSITLIASLVTALTLTPMLTSKLLKAGKDKPMKRTRLYSWTESVFRKIDTAYSKVLSRAINNRLIVILIAVALFAFSLYSARDLGTDYIPEFDAGDVSTVLETEVGTNVEETKRVAMQVEKIYREEAPEMVSLMTIAGQTNDGTLSSVGFAEGKNIATIIAHLTVPSDRERSAKEIAERIRERVEKIPEVESFHVNGGSIMSSAILGNKKPIEIEISGNDLKEINHAAFMIENELSRHDIVRNLENTVDKGKLEMQIHVDKDLASALGLNTAMVAMQVRKAIYGSEAGALNDKGQEYDINVRYAPDQRQSIDKLENLTLTTLKGEAVPLKTVATIEQGLGAMQIEHQSQQRIVKVGMEPGKGISLGEATKRVKEIMQEMQFSSNVDVEIAGQVSDQQDSFGSLNLVFIVGILLVYMVMAAQFESFKEPFIIIFAIPFSIIGVIWAFKVTGLTLSVVTFVGAIMLLGIVVNNGIVLVDYTNLLRKRGNSLKDAVLKAGESRLRPVLMTTFTTLLGMVPMALSTGMGSEMWQPLGITIIGGLLVSAIITLFFVPVLYTSMNYKALRTKETVETQKML